METIKGPAAPPCLCNSASGNPSTQTTQCPRHGFAPLDSACPHGVVGGCIDCKVGAEHDALLARITLREEEIGEAEATGSRLRITLRALLEYAEWLETETHRFPSLSVMAARGELGLDRERARSAPSAIASDSTAPDNEGDDP